MSWSWCPVSPPGLFLVGVYMPEGTLIPIFGTEVIACSQPVRLWCVCLMQEQPSPHHFIPKGCRIWAEIRPPPAPPAAALRFTGILGPES